MKSNNFKKINWKNLFYNVFIGKTVARKLFMFYLYAIVFGVIFLSLPISLKHPGIAILSDGTERPYQFIDGFFISVSAFTDTGLSTLNVLNTYNIFGQFIILFLIQIGGLGLFTLYWLFWTILFNNIIYKKIKHYPLHEKIGIGFSNSLIIASERGNTKLGLSIKSIKTAVIFILTTEIIFMIAYALFFYFVPSYQQIDITKMIPNTNLETNTWYIDDLTKYNYFYKNAGYSIWAGLFQSISTMNNAGFDIISQASYSPFRNGIWTIFLYISMIQIIIGGIGYPVIYDIIEFFKKRYHKQKFKLSLFTKLSSITYIVIFLLGIAFIFGFEFGMQNNSLITSVNSSDYLRDVYFGSGKIRTWNQITSLIYDVISSRSAGLATFSQSTMSYASIWLINILMFIGCAPSSTGGGIRTTTLGLIFMTLVSYMRGLKGTTVFKRTIPNKTVVNSSIIILTSLILVLLFSFISYPLMININPHTSLTISDVLFEMSSAYGTVGLSTGLSSILNSNSASADIIMILLCIIMIIGQLGISTSIFVFRSKENNQIITYPKEDIRI